jgi:hypothetical protein
MAKRLKYFSPNANIEFREFNRRLSLLKKYIPTQFLPAQIENQAQIIIIITISIIISAPVDLLTNCSSRYEIFFASRLRHAKQFEMPVDFIALESSSDFPFRGSKSGAPLL